MKHEKFNYKSVDEIRQKAKELNVNLPYSNNLAILKKPINIGRKTANNRFAFQPMEGSDASKQGSITELTRRRYLRFAKGGPAIIWFEAVAVATEVRASAHQLMINKSNVDEYKLLLNDMREVCMKENGFEPIIIMQATNSGRYSKPNGIAEPLIVYNNPILESEPISKDRILSDEQLKKYEEIFGPIAKLAQQAGFDGIDIKACHRYLISETLSAYTRKGIYGGSYENRTRFINNAYSAAQSSISGDFFLSSRLNVYDGFEYPYGFGTVENEGIKPELSESIKLIGMLKDKFNIPLINITIGNPYKNPHVNRPYDNGDYIPAEHPLEGEERMMNCVKTIQQEYPDLPVIGSAFSYFRQFAANVAAGMVESNACSFAGFGREAFAYPQFIHDVFSGKGMDPKKVCLTCGGCAKLLRSGTPSGCAIRDEQYKGKL